MKVVDGPGRRHLAGKVVVVEDVGRARKLRATSAIKFLSVGLWVGGFDVGALRG
jgi:hypothetical protein